MDDNNDNGLTGEFLKSLHGIKPAEPSPFFYTRLKGSMQQRSDAGNTFPMPGWVIGILFLFLTINILVIVQGRTTIQQTAEKKSPVQIFAETYNLNSDSNY